MVLKRKQSAHSVCIVPKKINVTKKPLTTADLVEEIKAMKQINDTMEEDIKDSDVTIAMLKMKEKTYLETIKVLEEKENSNLQKIKTLENRLEMLIFQRLQLHLRTHNQQQMMRIRF